MSNDRQSNADEDSRGDMDLLSLTLRPLDLSDGLVKEKNAAERGPQLSKKTEDNALDARDDSWSRRRSPEVLNAITLDEVAWHDTVDDCWLVIYDYVYDCTEFLNNHPGGLDVLLEYAGRDATLAFIGTGHSTTARRSLERYLIGELPPQERLFRIPGGVQLPGEL